MAWDPKYIQDVSAWDEWKREYRYGAFFVFPPSGVIENIDALRLEYDPESAAICQAHVSLSESLPERLSESCLKAIEGVLKVIPSFKIAYRDLHATPPYPGVVYSITPDDKLKLLRDTIHSTPAFEGSALRRAEIPFHMTIAEFISIERSHELATELCDVVPEGEWLCDRVEYAVPDEQFHFDRVAAIRLA